MKNNSVAVVVLNYNGWKDTLKCLKKLPKQTYKNFKTILIDNGSSEPQPPELSKIINSEVVFIEQPKNLGFAGGVNIGIKYALENNFEYVALLNNDAVPDKNWLKILVESIERNHAHIATGLLLSGDGTHIDSTSETYSRWGLPFPRDRGKKTKSASKSGYIFGASGGASLYKASLFKEVGLFDEKFFAYYEDVDISFRAQLEGYKVYYEDSAIAYHNHGSTSKKISGFTVYQTFKNLPILFYKNTPGGMFLAIGTRLFIVYTLFFWRAVFSGNAKYAFRGWFGSIKLIPYAVKQRRVIQSKKKISDQHLKSIIYPLLPPDQTKLRRLFYREK